MQITIVLLVLLSIVVSVLSSSIFIQPLDEEDEFVEEVTIDFYFNLDLTSLFAFILTLTVTIFVYLENNIYLAVICSVLILVSIWDFKFKLVPDTPIVIIGAFALVYLSTSIELPPTEMIQRILITFGIGVGLVLLSILSNSGIGGADLKLFIAISLLLTFDNFFLMFALTWLIGAIIEIPSYLITKKESFALVPYISIATLVTLMYGDLIIEWYTMGGIVDIFA